MWKDKDIKYNPNENEESRRRDMFGQMNDKEIKGILLFYLLE